MTCADLRLTHTRQCTDRPAEARSLTFAHRCKVFLASTPTEKGGGRIEREFEASDQRRYFVTCPHCGEQQWLKPERLR